MAVNDKLLHVMAFFGATVGLGLLLSQFMPVSYAILIIIGLGTIAGVGKEYLDRKKTGVSIPDLKADFVAMAFGFVALALIGFYKGEDKDAWKWLLAGFIALIVGFVVIIIVSVTLGRYIW
ncbi:MAG: hypothetical protein MUP55_01455 [Candidatus Aenigmarchaeota archaeon]|nr:hypothetical protein [Candidatus Aenigmarchaeota archaeon]